MNEKELVRDFLTHCQSSLAELDEVNLDFKKIEFMAHQIKGTSGVFGLQSIVEAAIETERQLKEKNVEGIRSALNTLKQLVTVKRDQVGSDEAN